MKECFLKLKGLSVFDMSKVPSFICGDSSGKAQFSFDAAVPAPLVFHLYELAGAAGPGGPAGRYMLASVTEGETELQPVIRWFSELSLPCRSIAEIKAALSPAETVSPKT